jgi:hypothetical protein
MAKQEHQKQVNPNQLDIELTDEVAEGTYSNLAIITHSNTEFIIDFIKIMPGIPRAKVKSRVLLTPVHAKRLLRALSDNISKFEASYGKIEDSTGFEGFPMNFGGPTPEA